jgi:uncharacterized protein (DUF305 family)
MPSPSRIIAAALLTVAVGSACSSAPRPSVAEGPAPAQLPPGGYPHTEADVQFMAGMIPHHAQAVKMAVWVPTHGSNASVRALAERIVVGQKDEIALMQQWLRDRNETVPAADATHLRMMHNGVAHDMLMPGMLTDAELASLEKARGAEFDRMFITFMIRHHEGAIKMVDELFSSPGAAQEETVFRFASDVYADQTTEIDRMLKILEILPPAR